MLSDLERGLLKLVFSDGAQLARDDDVFSEWNDRFDLTQASYRVQEPLLCIQRIILGLSDQHDGALVKQEIGQRWLTSARVARKSNQMQAAYSFLLNASQYSLPEVCLEKAKWLWNKGDGHQALICLQKGVAEHFSSKGSHQNPKQKAAHAKALLLIGRCIEDTAKVDSNTVMRRYKEVVDIHPEWEDGHFYMAKYYDRLMLNLTDRPERAGEFVYHIIQDFGQSLRYGNQHIYQSMPHLLTRWLDYGAHVADLEKGKAKSSKTSEATRARLIQINMIMDDLTKKLAPYQFLTSFSQLISRICHAHPAVFQHLQEIIAKVIVNFPQQAVWMSMAVSKSTHQMRQVRCRDIFSRAVQLQKSLQRFIQDATKLTDRLLELCNKAVDRDCNLLSINKDFRNLKRLVTDRNFSNIIVPLQSLMTVTLPSSQTPHKQHDPFPTTPVYICGFDDGVEVLASLQQPKKIGIQGNNGKVYVMLCKPKDDLRKDNRLMEVNGIINKCLMKNADARWRQLHIRTYAVIPLNEECGLIEWVPNTSGLRHILNRLYRQNGIFVSGQELKALIPHQSDKLEVKLSVFRDKLLPKYPPIFGEWFLKTFPDPTSWYLSRLSYARTAAVMSMVGYILGLGDRHGENILMDSTRGDCVHVDFNCLFNKGETFDWPEVVPFRLTHNMLNGMGPLSVEGVFRRACEVTMAVMRDQKDPLMSVLKTLIYDPLVEWSKPSRSRSATHQAADTGEINNEKAQVHVHDIELRLQGKLKSKHRGLPLSIEGHVDHLIREAIDDKNLCQMYVGWAAYL